MIICPACGSNVNADLCLGCSSCGARAVGPPLAKAEYQLPSFGRAALAAASGLVLSAVFLGSLIVALVQNGSGWFRFWSIVTAGEVAAWRLKWSVIPVALAVLWLSARIVRTIKDNPKSFIGLRAARSGLVASITITVLIAGLIGITVPERLRQRRMAVGGDFYSKAHTLHRAMLEYRERHGSLPDSIKDLRELPDPDGSIARALADADPNGYVPSAVLASASTNSKPRAPRGSVLRNVDSKATTDPATDRVVSFTNYELRLPGEDKVLNTDDDLIIRDGLVLTLPEYKEYISSHTRVP